MGRFDYDDHNDYSGRPKRSGCGTVFFIIVLIYLAYYFISNGGIIKKQDPAYNANNTSPAGIHNAADNSAAQHYKSYYDGSLGTCGDLKGNVLIVSIFISDKNTSWDASDKADQEMINKTLRDVRTATEYLREQAASYGSRVQFIYDWSAYPELIYSAQFKSVDMVTAEGTYYNTQSTWIKRNIDIQGLKDKFSADHVLFINFFDTALSNPVHCWSLGASSFPEGSKDTYYIELINLFCRFENYVTMPSVYAHEMLHAFGAHDLYYASSQIPQSYVDNLNRTGSRDIMFTVTSSDEITNYVSPLDAYYIGIAPAPEEVSYWKLSASEH